MSGDDLWFDEPGDELDDELPDELDEDEFPNDEWDDDSAETAPCPECGAEVYEDAVQCPVCGNYITHQTRIWSGRPGWWVILGLLGVLAAVLVLAGLAPW